jgi:hypothetical protein
VKLILLALVMVLFGCIRSNEEIVRDRQRPCVSHCAPHEGFHYDTKIEGWNPNWVCVCKDGKVLPR